ncbi:hypothetical protein KFE25_002461 [Diacronema lutheri]|uniref:Uncharacterized protein n=1 Tax=Diacronema lutheri TaxID=2081491 RepID=A0A7R9YP23_DIALT|nr:hypothetical protein KFE25_002461 [Diacronema lutheri]|mmetsp:Transcript_7956/g.25124  ORF Transcript_7956/g.25124 Transcript_7956/m.25124 type:complete len:386 (+) Transcript_7956:8-1165(+)
MEFAPDHGEDADTVVALLAAKHNAEVDRLRWRLHEAERSTDRLDASRRRADAEASRLRAELEAQQHDSQRRLDELKRRLAEAAGAAKADALGEQASEQSDLPLAAEPAHAAHAAAAEHSACRERAGRLNAELAVLSMELDQAERAHVADVTRLLHVADAQRRLEAAYAEAAEARFAADAAREREEEARAESDRARREGTLIIERIDLRAHSHVSWAAALDTARAAARLLPPNPPGCAQVPTCASGRTKPAQAGPRAPTPLSPVAATCAASAAPSRRTAWVCDVCAFVNPPDDAEHDGPDGSPEQCEVCTAPRPAVTSQSAKAAAAKPSLSSVLVSSALNATGLSAGSARARAAAKAASSRGGARRRQAAAAAVASNSAPNEAQTR